MITTKPSDYQFLSFLKGFASIFNLSGQVFLKLPDLTTGFERDRDALISDWQRIGKDMRGAVNQVIYERR